MPDIRFGGEQITAIYWGSTPVDAVYLGSTLIWPTGLAVDSMVWADYAPAVATGKTVAVPTDALVWADYAPIVFIEDGSVHTDEVVWTDFAPFVSTGVIVDLPSDAVVWADFSPTVSISATVPVPTDVMEWTDAAPLVVTGVNLEVEFDEAAWTDFAPTILTGVNALIPTNVMVWRDFGVVSGYGFSAGFSTGFAAIPANSGATLPASDAVVWRDYPPTVDAIALATREYRAVKSVSNGSGSSFTATSCDVGSAAVGRIVVAEIFVVLNSNRTIASATIGGVTARVNIQRNWQFVSDYFTTAIISAPLAAGSTADIVVTLSGSASYSTVRVSTYKTIGLGSNVEQDTATQASDSGNNKVLEVDVEEGGLAFACGYMRAASGTGFSFTGAGENFDSNVNTNMFIAGASLEVTADESGRDITVTGSNQFGGALVAASFR